MSKKLIAIQHATARFTVIRDLALAALERDESRACLDAFCELMDLYVACTGGTVHTVALRAQLADIQTRVAGVSHLRALPPAAVEPPALDYKMEAAAQCHCGGNITVQYVYAGVFEARCLFCYDGTADSGELSLCRGHGPTPEAALAEWQERHEELTGLEWWPKDLDWQVDAERRRTAGWVETVTEAGVWFAPEILEGHAPDLHNCATK